MQIHNLFSEYNQNFIFSDDEKKSEQKVDNEICDAADYKVSAIVKASAVNTIKMTSVGF